MTWLWLTGSGVLLFTFIVTALSVPPTLAANWQLIQSAVRRVRRPKHPSSVVATAPKDEVSKARTPTPCLPPSHVMLRDYRYNGGAVPTSAVMDVGSSMHCLITQPDSDHCPSLSVLFGSSPTGAGTAAYSVTAPGGMPPWTSARRNVLREMPNSSQTALTGTTGGSIRLPNSVRCPGFRTL